MSHSLQTIARAGRTGIAVADLPADLAARLIERPAELLETGPVNVIKDGDGVLVAKTVLTMPGGPLAIAWKRVHRTTRLKQWSQLVGPNRIVQSFFAGHRLLDLGIATARPLLVVVPSRFDVTAPTWLAAEWIDEAETLSSCVSRCADLPPAEAARRLHTVGTAVGQFVGQLHRHAIAHRDLKPQNLMIRCDAAGRHADVFAIDLDGVRFPRRLTTQRRWKNLSRLAEGDRGWPVHNQSASYRFLTAYLAASRLDLDRRVAWQTLATATADRIAHREAKHRAA